MTGPVLPSGYDAARSEVQRVAVHVLARARHQAVGDRGPGDPVGARHRQGGPVADAFDHGDGHDTGTPMSLVEASEYVRTIEQRQGQRIACLEEIAYRNGWIDEAAMEVAADKLAKSGYGAYLRDVLRDVRESGG